jgi:hypothetical protein
MAYTPRAVDAHELPTIFPRHFGSFGNISDSICDSVYCNGQREKKIAIRTGSHLETQVHACGKLRGRERGQDLTIRNVQSVQFLSMVSKI